MLKSSGHKSSKKKQRANMVETSSEAVDNSDQAEYAFACGKSSQGFYRLYIEIGGVNVNFIADSGSYCNLIGCELWEMLKSQKIACTSRKTIKTVYPYASDKSLKVLGVFEALANTGNREAEQEFVVIEWKADALLGYKTAE